MVTTLNRLWLTGVLVIAGGLAAPVRAQTAPAPTAITASDYLYASKVSVSVTAPAAPLCSIRNVVIARDGVDLTTITTIPAGGGSATYDDAPSDLAVHTYTARS